MYSKKHYINFFFLIFLLPAVILNAKGRDTSEVKQPFILDNKKFNSMVVATIGDIQITAQEFLTSYEYGPAFVKREKDSPKRYLNFMIFEKLLAKEGYSKGIDKSEELNMILSDIEGDLATEQLYRKNIWNKVKISKREIDKGVGKEKITLNLKWIYKPTLQEIEYDFNQIKKGLSFDSLFSLQFSDTTVKYEDRYMETTRFQLERNNSLLARIIDSLKPGEISRPIKTQDGCYIVKVANLWKNMITTESEMNKLRYDVERALFKDRSDSLSGKYVNKIMLSEKPVIIRETFNMLKAYIGEKILSGDQFASWDLLKNLRPNHPGFNPADIQPYAKEKLVDLKSGSISLAEFLRWYTTREPYIKFNLKSHQTLYESLEQTVWRMVRDRLLTEIAFKQKLNQVTEVKVQKKWWRDKLVYSQMKLDIANSIQLDDQKIKDYYEQNKRRYTDEKGATRSFDDAKSDVKNDLMAYEYTKKVVNKVLGLKEHSAIKINDDVLNKLPIDIKNDPKAIDVYTVKNGGTFMRQAYPTIDFEWQYWN